MPKRSDYPRDCPRCGDETEVWKDAGVRNDTPKRECVGDDCPWWLYKGGW